MPKKNTNTKKKVAKKKVAKKKVVKPEFQYLDAASKRTVLSVARAEIKKESEGRKKIWEILDSNKSNHIKLALEVYKYAEKMKVGQANQTLKNYVYEWRQANDLQAKPKNTDKGGQSNEGKAGAVEKTNETIGESFDCKQKTEDGIVEGFRVLLRTEIDKAGGYPEGKEEAHVWAIGGKTALAWSRICKEQCAELTKEETESIQTDLENVTTDTGSDRVTTPETVTANN
jgi:hypothetical protein